jgi:peptidoglycan/LPS O-acetylase OafA/YrhL
MSYRADIDGLRAIAVLAVLAFHYALHTVPGGFIGVDVFFVISGYLITAVLLEDISGTGLSLLSFYERRIRRIFPAMLVVLLASLAVGCFLLPPGDFVTLGWSSLYAAGSFANLYFFGNTGYGDQAARLMPLLHLWSLAVEEQFYLAWPLLLAGIIAVARGSRRMAVGLVIGVIAASFVANAVEARVEPMAAFYLPHSRGWEFGLGALLVFVKPLRLRRWGAEGARIAGAALVVCSSFMLTVEASPAGLPAALLPCLGAALLIWPTEQRTIGSAVLGAAPLRFIGQISYSLYLWHWPVLVFYRFYAETVLTVAETTALAGLSFVLAILSWRYVEQPFRRRRWRPSRTVLSGVAAAAVAAGLALVVVAGEGWPLRFGPQGYAMRNLDAMWEWDCPQTLVLGISSTPVCVIGAPWDSAARHGVLWGDSHAEHFAPLLDVAARQDGVSLILYRACPPFIDGRRVKRYLPATPTYNDDCAESQSRAIDYLKREPGITTVVLAAAWSGYLNRLYADAPEGFSAARSARLMRDGLQDLLPKIAANDREVILLADVPRFGFIPTSCALRPHLCRENVSSIPWREYVFRQSPSNDVLRAVAAHVPSVRVYIPADDLCSPDGCLTRLNGEFLYRDNSHLRRNLTRSTQSALSEMLHLRDLLQPQKLSEN